MSMDETVDMTEKEFLNDFKENYSKVRKLLDEDSKNDPENEPYLSKYKAKNILINMRDTLVTIKSDPSVDTLKIDAMLGSVLLNMGIVDMETEELTSSEKVLMEAVDLLTPNAMKPEIVETLIKIYNNLGILWSNRDEHEKAKMHLLNAKGLYESFKCTLQMPLPLDLIISANDEIDKDNLILPLEKAYTLTLYYLAQVYGCLKLNLMSAIYCHVTLKRQMLYSDYEPIDWALNSAALSQYFAEQNGFVQARHHLAAASIVLEKYEVENYLGENRPAGGLPRSETFRHRAADVSRCWAKYCLLLMTASKARLMNDAEKLSDPITDMSNMTIEFQDVEDISGGDMKNLVFPNLETSNYEQMVSANFLLTFEDAKAVFLICQTWLSKAKDYYRLDSLASDYIELIQDGSQCYSYLAFFEEDDERRAKMHKRRVDMLENLLQEVNPTYYMQYCRQLWFELGEVYSDILNIKLHRLNKSTERPNPQLLNKINNLCDNSIQNYEKFIDSVKDKNGRLPRKLEVDLIRPVISAYAFIGRNSMKRISVDKSTQLSHVRVSFNSYQAVVDICNNDEEAALMMKEEFSLCREMVKFLPIKIKKLEGDLIT